MRLRGVVAVVASLLSVFFLAGSLAAQEPIRIGLQAPITGPWAYEGEMARNSVEIVKDQINARGGVLGRPIEIVLGDDQGNPRQSALVAQRMVSDGVVAVIGTYGSSINEAASTIYERAGLVNIGYGSTAVQLTEHGWQYFFRTCFRDDRQGAFFAQLVNETLGASRVAILHDNTTFARGLAEAARASLEADGLAEVVFYDAVTPGERDFTPTLSRMRARSPEVVYYTGYYPEGALIARQMQDLGIDALFVGGNAAINDEFVEIAGLDVAAGALMTQEPLPTDLPYGESQAFLEEYVARHGQPPSSPWPVYAADALLVLAAAIEATGSTDSATLADYIRGPLAVDGITGPLSFDSQGDREGAIYLAYQVGSDGQLRAYEP